MELIHDDVLEYKAKSKEFEVSVVPFFIKYSTEENEYIWQYKVRIENNSDKTVQIISRKWHIIDKFGTQEIVTGDGVVGQKPYILPNTYFEYSSHVKLKTNYGMMYGTYIVSDLYETFEITIPVFSLWYNIHSYNFN